MYQKSCVGLVTVVVLLAIGCSQSPVAPSPPPAAASAAATTVAAMPGGANVLYGMKGQDVPFSGVVTGEAAFDTNPKDCDAGFTTVTTAKGQASHMGLTSWQSQHCLSEANDFLDAELVLSAANGDKIYATYTGRCVGLPVVGESVTCSGNLVFSGGTGRFKNASGTAELSASIVFEGFTDPSWPGRWEWKGMINY